MQKGKTLYVSDLDGTLLQPDATISEESLRMLNSAIGEGALFTIATARTPATVAPILSGLDLGLPAIVMTGTALWDKDTGKYSNVHYMEDKAVKELVRIYRKAEFPTFLYTLPGDKIKIYHLGPLSDIERQFIAERNGNPYKSFDIPASGDSALPDYLGDTILFYGMQPAMHSEETFRFTSQVAGIRAQKYYDFYGPEIGILEAFSPLSTKAHAIKELAVQIGADRVVVFGDNLNDLSMFEIADVAVAMENAVEEVKKKADIIIGPNTADSVAHFILGDMQNQE